MAARGALADRVRVADADDRYFRLDGACDEGGQEGVHGACACRSSTACSLLRAPAAGLARALLWRGCSRRRVRGGTALPSYARRRRADRWGRHGNDTNLQHYRSVRVCERTGDRRAQVSAGDASGPRPAGTGAQRPPGKSKASGAALPPCSRSRWPPGVTPRARARVAALHATPAPPLPAASSARRLKAPCCPWELPHS